MATAETVQLGPAHAPLPESFEAFRTLEHDLKKSLLHSRHEQSKHEPEFFSRVSSLSNDMLTDFGADDLKEVRIGTTAYGKHLLGKVSIPRNDEPAFLHFRAFIPGGPETARLHCIRMEEIDQPDGNKLFRAIFSGEEQLEWFDE